MAEDGSQRGAARPRVLVLDAPEAAEGLAERLRGLGFEPMVFARAAALLDGLAAADVAAVVSDLDPPDMAGLAVVQAVLDRRPEVPVLLMTGVGTMQTAISALRAGAFDFLLKPVAPEALDVALARAVEHRRLRAEVRRLRRQVGEAPGYGGLVGTSRGMQRVYRLIDRVAPSNASVLIRGESGTGKELVARAIHARSRRAAGPFVAVNCAAVPEQLLESELFGHRKGAFTGADETRPGLFREADGGTLFLDEIGEMSPKLQPKLLRALQEQVIRPVGGREEPIDVRVVAATHQDIARAIEDGRFRADLFYRLNVISIDVPPLRERGDDVALLAERFAMQICARDGRPALGFSASAATALLLYAWPGNVRELQNAVEHAVMLCAGDEIEPADLPAAVAGDFDPEEVEPAPASGFLTLFEVERRHILRVYAAVGENKSEAARVLGIDRKTLHTKLMRYGRS